MQIRTTVLARSALVDARLSARRGSIGDATPIGNRSSIVCGVHFVQEDRRSATRWIRAPKPHACDEKVEDHLAWRIMTRRRVKWFVTAVFFIVAVVTALSVGFVAIWLPTDHTQVALGAGGLGFSHSRQPFAKILNEVWLDLPGRSRPDGPIRLTLHGGTTPLEWLPRYGVPPKLRSAITHNGFVPLWPFTAALGFTTVLLWRRDRRTLPGRCESCGYDLRGNVSGICSECGKAVSLVSSD